jgi:photosystem II stability/assembly factor-like uncharacterized protein
MTRASAAVLFGCTVFALAGGGCASKHAASPQSRTSGSFEPQSFTAISENDYWVLGTVRHEGRLRFSILRTTDGGRSFETIGAPQLPTEGTVPTLRFADRRDGFAFVLGFGGTFFATHDGGTTWQKLRLGTVLAFETARGNVYVVTARCSRPACSRYRLERSPAWSNAWRPQALPFTPDGSIVDLAAHGSHVWLLGTPRRNPQAQRAELVRSTDGARTFVKGHGPCYPGLGGDLEPSSTSVVWAVCPTGMLAGAWRSIDGGTTFVNLKTPPLVNSATLAPASANTAVLARNGARTRLLRTTDGGRTWQPVQMPPPPAYTLWVGFTDAEVGAAIVETAYQGAAKPQRQELWRTTDGGAHWHSVRLG